MDSAAFWTASLICWLSAACIIAWELTGAAWLRYSIVVHRVVMVLLIGGVLVLQGIATLAIAVSWAGANFERTIDGFLAGLPHDRLLPAVQTLNVAPFDKPVLDLGF